MYQKVSMFNQKYFKSRSEYAMFSDFIDAISDLCPTTQKKSTSMPVARRSFRSM